MKMILFSFKVSPTEIESLDFQQLRYWSDAVNAINKARNDEIKKENARKK